MDNLNFNKLEVLSPAGNAECFSAALENGADAIYLGLSSFNARMKAQNFSAENIREYVSKAHLFGVKIYVTINTLLTDDDFDELINMVKFLIEAKVDAFIVQDLGVAHVLKNAFSGIVLHASTQMGIHNLYGAKVAEELGFSRIVLSRETKLEDIKLIKENTNLEIEYFVQGALCVAFSGNCYYSSLEKGLSGNEGKCLQLCRLPFFNNQTNETKYYLSPRDLCLIENLQELIDAGVTSFKIEGRMRHAGYVATATHAYKSLINAIKLNKLNKDFINKCEELLKISYSRGDFNKNAYLKPETPNDVINCDYQNHIGKFIGTVKKVEPFKNDLFKVTIESSHSISKGDGLKIINPKTKTQVASLGVGNTEKLSNNLFAFYTKNKFESGLDVHLTQDSLSEEKLLKNRRKIKINIKIIANFNETMKVFAENEFAKVEIESELILEKAKSNPISKDDFFAQFNKLNDSVFEINKFEVETNGVFLPKSLLNELRRKTVSALEAKTIFENEKYLNVSFNKISFENVKNEKIKTIPYNLSVIDNENFDANKNTIYVYAPSSYNNCSPEQILQKTKPENFALSIPNITSSRDTKVIESILKRLPKNIYLYINNISGLWYSKLGYKVIVSPLLNVKNNYALKCLNSFNIHTICASVESSLSFANENNLIWFEKGNFPLMTLTHCPYKTIHGTTCSHCTFNNKLVYKSDANISYKINRTKLHYCYFELTKQLFREKAKFNIINFKD